MLECLFCQIFSHCGDRGGLLAYSVGELGKPKLDPAPLEELCPRASWARFAGFPERDEAFFLTFFFLPRPAPPGIGPIPGIWGTPPLATVFIILAAW